MKSACFVLLLSFAAPLLADPAPTTAPVNYFEMTPEAFAESPAALQNLDESSIDHNLLNAAVHHATNVARRENKLGLLKHLSKLDEASMLHAKAMAEGDFFAHENPNNPELHAPVDRAKKVGLVDYKLVAENIATHFGIQYESGRGVIHHGPNLFSYQDRGPMIPRHTYQSFAKTLVDRWMNSPTHRANILLKEARFHGSACTPVTKEDEMTTYYCVQLFYDQMPPQRPARNR